MADYAATFLPGNQITGKASGTIAGGDPLEVSGSGTVAKAGAASAKYVGIAASDAISGGNVTYFAARPVFDGNNEGGVTAGDQLCVSAVANRQVKTVAASAIDVGATFVQGTVNTAINAGLTAARSVIGLALTTATDGNVVRWMQAV